MSSKSNLYKQSLPTIIYKEYKQLHEIDMHLFMPAHYNLHTVYNTYMAIVIVHAFHNSASSTTYPDTDNACM